MKTTFLIGLMLVASAIATHAQEKERYIEVTGSAEVEIVPDEIHYIIQIKEYWAEEFDGKSKPEEYRVKVPLSHIEKELRQTLRTLGIADKNIRTQEMGNYWRQTGKDFLTGKRFDLALSSFQQVDTLLNVVSTRGIESMYIGELKNKNDAQYRKQGKINALKAAREKAEYLLRAVGENAGEVLRITETDAGNHFPYASIRQAQSNISDENAGDGEYRVIKRRYEITARFAIADVLPRK